MENWKSLKIEGYSERYLVSSYGRVRIKNGKILNQSYDSKGYLKVQLYINKKQICRKVHRLVAITFLDKVDGKDQVNHIDGDKTNNHFENLEWMTCKENVRHAYENGLAKVGAMRHNSKKLVLKNNDGKIISQYSNISTLSNMVNIGPAKIVNTMLKNGLQITFINKFDNTIPIDLKLNSFNQRHAYCPIGVYDDELNILAMYSNILEMTKNTLLSESIGNKAKIDDFIRHKKRGNQFKNFYHLKKLTFEEFFLTNCKNIDTHIEIK